MSEKIDSKLVFDNNTNRNNNSSRRDVNLPLQARFLGQIDQKNTTRKFDTAVPIEQIQSSKDIIACFPSLFDRFENDLGALTLIGASGATVIENDLGALTLSGETVNENDQGALIGTLSAESNSGNKPYNYIVDDDRFEVVEGQLKLKDGVSLDYKAESEVLVTVTALSNDVYAPEDSTEFESQGWGLESRHKIPYSAFVPNSSAYVPKELASETFTIDVVDVDEAPPVLYTATVTDESGAAVLTVDTESAPAYESVQQVAQRIVETQYEPMGQIDANEQFIVFRMDAEVQSVFDNGDDTYTITVSQEFVHQYFNAGGDNSYDNTDTYTVSLEEQTETTTESPDTSVGDVVIDDGRHLSDDSTSDVGDGIINGDTAEGWLAAALGVLGRHLSDDSTTIDVVDVDEAPPVPYTATVTDESGAAVLTVDTESAPAYESVQQVAQRIVETQYEPMGQIDANEQFIVFRMDAEVQSVFDNGDDTYTITVSQEFVHQYFNAGGDNSYDNTDTYTVSLEEQTETTTESPDTSVGDVVIDDGRHLSDDSTTIDVVDVDEAPPVPYTATVTDESGAAVLTVDTESAPAYESVQQVAQRIVETQYEPMGQIDANEQFIVFRMDAEVQSVFDNGDDTYTITVSQEFVHQYFNAVGDNSYDNTDTYTVSLEEQTETTTESPDTSVGDVVIDDGRHLSDDSTSDVGDGIINGDTAEERLDDLKTESGLLIWDAIIQQSGGEVPRWTAEGWLAAALGVIRESSGVSEADVGELTPDIIVEFITANVNADGTIKDAIDYSMIPPTLQTWVRDSIEIGGKLFHSAQQNLNGGNPDIPQGSFILPSAVRSEAATGSFLLALQSDVTGDSTSAFVTDGNKWQEFLSSGITDHGEIINGHISDESVVNDSLTKAILWVGKDIIGELGQEWTGPSAADFDSATFVDDHKVYSISYTRDGQSFSGLYTQEEFDSLTQEHLDSTINIDSSGGTAAFIGSVTYLDYPGTTTLHNITWVDQDGKRHNLENQSTFTLNAKLALHESGDIVITGSNLTSPTAVRIFWAQKALATYDATRTPTYGANGQLTAGASAEVRVARAFNALYAHNTNTDPDGNNILESTDYKNFVGFSEKTGTRLDPLLDTRNVSIKVIGTDAEATATFYTQLDKINENSGDEATGLGRIFGSWQGGTEITSVAGQFAKGRGSHPDHDSFTHVGNGDHAETAGDNILAALIERGRATADTSEDVLGFALSRETANDIRNKRWELIFVAAVDVAAVVLTAGGALYAASAEVAVLGAGGGAELQAAATIAEQEAAHDAAIYGMEGLGEVTTGATVGENVGTFLGTEALDNFIIAASASNASGASFIPFLTSASVGLGVLLGYGSLLAAGDIATQPDSFDPDQVGWLEEPNVQPGRSTVAIYRADGSGGVTLVREFDEDTPATQLGAAGQNLNELLGAAQIAFQVTEYVAGGGSGPMMALEYLNTATAGADTPDIIDVLQWLDKETTEAVKPFIAAAVNDELEGFLSAVSGLDLTDIDDIKIAAGLIDDLSPADGREAIIFISKNYGPDAAPNVLAAMDPAAAGAIVVFDQNLHLYNQTNRGASAGPLPGPTVVVEQLLMLTVSDPESAGAILSAAGENDIEVGGHVLESMIRTSESSNIVKTLVHADPLVASALLDEALQTERDATPDWTPETSKLLKVRGGLWLASLDVSGQSGLDEWVTNQADTVADLWDPNWPEAAVAHLHEIESSHGARAVAEVLIFLGNSSPSTFGNLMDEVINDVSDVKYKQGVDFPMDYLAHIQSGGLYSAVEDLAYRMNPRLQSVGQVLGQKDAAISQRRVDEFLGQQGSVPILADIISVMVAIEKVAPGTSGLGALLVFAELQGDLKTVSRAVEILSARDDGSAEELLAIMLIEYPALPADEVFENANTLRTAEFYRAYFGETGSGQASHIIEVSDEVGIAVIEVFDDIGGIAVDRVTGATIEFRGGEDSHIVADVFGNDFEVATEFSLWVDGIKVDPTTLYVGPSMDGTKLVVGIEVLVDPNDTTAESPKAYYFVDFEHFEGQPPLYVTGLLKPDNAQSIAVNLETLVTHDTENPAAEAYLKYLLASDYPSSERAQSWIHEGIKGMFEDNAVTQKIMEAMEQDLIADGVMIDGATMVVLGLLEESEAEPESVYFVPPSDGLQARFDVLGMGSTSADILYVYDPEVGHRREIKVDWSAFQFNPIPPVTHIADRQWESTRFNADGSKDVTRVNARSRFASVPLSSISPVKFGLPVGLSLSIAILRNVEPGEARQGYLAWSANANAHLTLSIRVGKIHTPSIVCDVESGDEKPQINTYNMVEVDLTFVAATGVAGLKGDWFNVGKGLSAGDAEDVSTADEWISYRFIEGMEVRRRYYRPSSKSPKNIALNTFASWVLGAKVSTRLDTIDFTISFGARQLGGEPGYLSSDLRAVQIFSVSAENAPAMASTSLMNRLEWLTTRERVQPCATSAVGAIGRSWMKFWIDRAPTAANPIPPYDSTLTTILPAATPGAATRTFADFVAWVGAAGLQSGGLGALGVVAEVVNSRLGTAFAQYVAPGITEIVSYSLNSPQATIVRYFADGTMESVFQTVADLVSTVNDIRVDLDLNFGGTLATWPGPVIPNIPWDTPVATPWSPFIYQGEKSLYYVTWATAYRVRMTFGDKPADPAIGPPSNTPAISSPWPSEAPSQQPSNTTSVVPSAISSPGPSETPSEQPSNTTSVVPSAISSPWPSETPSEQPSNTTSVDPSAISSPLPSEAPSEQPSNTPSVNPSAAPRPRPSETPSDQPSNTPSVDPSAAPRPLPSEAPSDQPSNTTSVNPSAAPRPLPSDQPSNTPSVDPSAAPRPRPSEAPSDQPSGPPGLAPSFPPTTDPTTDPTSGEPTEDEPNSPIFG